MTKGKEGNKKKFVSKEEFKLLCSTVARESMREALETFKQTDISDMKREFMKTILKDEMYMHEDGDELLELHRQHPGHDGLHDEIIGRHAQIMWAIYLTEVCKSREYQESLRTPQPEFWRLAQKIFRDVERNLQRVETQFESKSISIEVFQRQIEHTLSQHNWYFKLEKTMMTDEPHRHAFRMMTLKRVSMLGGQEEAKQDTESKSDDLEFKKLCLSMLNECRFDTLLKIMNTDTMQMIKMHYENWLNEEIYKHKDIEKILKAIGGNSKKCSTFMNFFKEYANNIAEQDLPHTVKQCILVRREKEKFEEERTNLEYCKRNNHGLQQKLKQVEKELEKSKKLVEKSLKINEEDKESLEEMRNQLQSYEVSQKLFLDTIELYKDSMENEKIEKEQMLGEMKESHEESLKLLRNELEKSENKMKNLEEERENKNKENEKMVNQLRIELEQSEKFIEDLKEKREYEEKEKEQMASKISAMKEFQRINNKETEEWKAQIMKLVEKQAEELRITKQELKKYKPRK